MRLRRLTEAELAVARVTGSIGGRARARRLSKARRVEIARQAARARWSSKRKEGGR